MTTMPNVLDGLFNQVMVYWPKGSINEDGEHSVGDPIEVVCRWESQFQELVDSQGSTYISQATIYTAYSSLGLEGWVWLSSAKPSDIEGTAIAEAPTDPPNNQIIRNIGVTPSLDNDEILYTVNI